jgi:hypothetical protein
MNKNNVVQICMTDVVFATRLWTKLPASHSWLPRHQIVAYAAANLVPNEGVKHKFLNTLHAESRITEEQALRIKHSRFTDEMLAMRYRDATDIDPKEALNAITNVIQRERARLEEATRSGYKAAISEAEARLNELKAAYADAEEQVARKSREELQLFEREIARQKERLEILEFFVGYVADAIMVILFIAVWVGVGLAASTLFGVSLGFAGATVAAISMVVFGAFTWLGVGWAQCRAWLSSHMLALVARLVAKQRNNRHRPS